MNSEKIDIYLPDYLSKKKIIKTTLINCPSYDDINVDELFSFSYTHEINKSCLMPNDNNSFIYSYVVPRIGDSIGDIVISLDGHRYSAININKNKTLKIKLMYSVGGILYEPNDILGFLFSCARFHEFKIIITFEELNNYELIELNVYYQRMSKQDFELLTDCNTRVFFGNIMYENDEVIKLNSSK